jgi:histidinol-phosphate aminotransferase
MYPDLHTSKRQRRQTCRCGQLKRVVDVDALLAACAKTKVVYIANPANPTGTMIRRQIWNVWRTVCEVRFLCWMGPMRNHVDGYDADGSRWW